jgi:AcrR family transcriptional regulator
MCPRPYRMGKRDVARAETRQRILEAARDLLSSEASTDLSLETIARRADVSRLTIYYHFRSRAGLLEALYDHLASRGHMERMGDVFRAPAQAQAFASMIETFVRFWSTDTKAMRRLRAMGVLDAEIGEGIRARDARRPHIAREIFNRLGAKRGKSSNADAEAVAAALGMLTSFETYDALATAGQSDRQIATILTRLASCMVDSHVARRHSR